jgi:hypothetical protein
VSKIPTLEEIVQAVECLSLRRRRKAPQGRKPVFSDSFIIALAVYQKLASFRHTQKMLEVMASLGVQVPAPSTFSERKALLLGHIILAVKQFCSRTQATRQHLDSKKLEVVAFARARGTKLAGAYGRDPIHNTTFYGFRLHARVTDAGQICGLLLRPANEHDVKVAPRLLENLTYTIITADKGYISRDLKADLAPLAVDLVTPRKSNQLPPPSTGTSPALVGLVPKREQVLYRGHRRVETTFSSLDRLGLSDRPYRSTTGLLVHVYVTILAYQFTRSAILKLRLCLFRIGVL